MRGTPNHIARTVPEEQMLGLALDFRKGDRTAFRMIYDMYHAAVYRFCRHMIADEAMSKDAFQETFIKAYEHRTELRGENVRSWLFTIARRVCLNQLRAKRSTHVEFDETYHAHDDAVQNDVVLREHIEKALAQLPLPLREALVLREYDGHSYQEISSIVGIDISLAKVRVYRARLLMRKLLTAVVMQDR